MHEDIVVEIDESVIVIKRPDDLKENRALHGTTRSLIGNMIEGVRNGFEKHLEIIGVGYRAQMQGNKLVVGAGYSHPVEMDHRSEEHTSELQSRGHLVCRLLLEKKNKQKKDSNKEEETKIKESN